MKFAVFVYSVPLNDSDDPDEAAEALDTLIHLEGVRRKPYIIVNEQIDIMEDFLLALEQHAAH